MRKLVTILNTVIREQKTWNQYPNTLDFRDNRYEN